MIPRTEKKAVLLMAFTEILLPVPGADGKNHYVPLLVGGKTVANQTRITTNDLFFSPTGTGCNFCYQWCS